MSIKISLVSLISIKISLVSLMSTKISTVFPGTYRNAAALNDCIVFPGTYRNAAALNVYCFSVSISYTLYSIKYSTKGSKFVKICFFFTQLDNFFGTYSGIVTKFVILKCALMKC